MEKNWGDTPSATLSIFADYFETVRYIVTHRIQSLGGRTKGQSEYDSANRIHAETCELLKPKY